MSTPPNIRCRQITEGDLPAVVTLLSEAFAARPVHWWQRGIDRLAARTVPEGSPRFGYLLEHDRRLVGCILLIFSTIEGQLRCNLSSWYVAPAFRSHAAMLSMMPFRHKGATFLNSSPAPNTWATIEAQGFRRFTPGQLIALPLLRAGPRGASMKSFAPGMDLPEAALLAEHQKFGCYSLVAQDADGLHPFVFLPFRGKEGRLPLPGVQLVYCRSLDELARFAGPISRYFLPRLMPFMLLDAEGPVPGLPGVFVKDRARKYFKGPVTPRLGDLAYTEFTVFGS